MITRKVNHPAGTGRNLLLQCLQETENEWNCVETPPRKSNKGFRTIKFTRNEAWKIETEYETEQQNIEEYNAFVKSLDNYNMNSCYEHNNDDFAIRLLKDYILQLLNEKNKIIDISMYIKDGEPEISYIGKRIYKIILWIKENMDIWDITELPQDENIYRRRFEFKWRNGNELEKKKNK